MEILRFIFKAKWYIFLLFSFLSMSALTLFFYQQYFKESSLFFFTMKNQIEIPKEKIKRFTLKNGMNILIFENKNIPKVLVQIAYDIGSSVEQSGEKGLAHLIEHMIFKGTDKLISEGDIDAIARKYGASFNAFTSLDATSYFFEVNKDNWKPFIPVLADCMQNAKFDEQHLASEIKAVIAELRRAKDNYWGVMAEKSQELLYPSNHPYHIPIIGFKEDLANLKAEDLKKFYKKYYHPNRATLFIVGNVDADETIELLKENFEHIPENKSATRATFPEIIPDLSSNITYIYRDINAPQLLFYWMIPGLVDKEKTIAKATEFILGWGEGSRLYSKLVDEEKIATAVSVSASLAYDAGTFFIFIQPKADQVKRCREIVENELNKIINFTPSRIELAKVFKSKKRQFFDLLENPQRFTYEWLRSFFATQNEFEMFEEVNKFSEITPQEISDFAKTYLDPFMMSEIVLLPAPESKRSILEIARKKDDELDEKILQLHKRTTPKEKPKYVDLLPDLKPLKFEFPKPEKEFVLKNGLKVLLRKSDAIPNISASIQFKDASLLSPSKEGILIGLMMDMLLEHSQNYNKKENVAVFENEGAVVSFGASGGSITSLKEHFDSVFKHFMHVLTKPLFHKEDLDKLRDIMIDNYERMKNDPSKIGSRILKNLVYPNHPFNWSFEDAIEELKKIQLQDIELLHKKYISPSSMVIAIVGDFDLDQMKNFIERSCYSWNGREYKPMNLPKPTVTIKKDIDYYMLRDQAILLFGQSSNITIYNEDYIPLQLLNFICWYSLGSRIFQLREETGLFYTASGAFASNASKEHGFDYIFTMLNNQNLEEAEKKIKYIVEDIAKNGVTQKELEVARALYLKDIIDLCDKNSTLASTYCYLDSMNLGFDYYDKVIERINHITLIEVNTVAKKYFSINSMSRIRVGRLGGKR